ncbi:ABC-F family ATP-binding cassette domain-containing protein [Reinekea blandensis]|uniref:ABC transporter, duplicated ATPase domains n=1 Tax=Reinekea blandensis MED297 TaxID=314283 RepID=A4BJ25_9GAMM|nr:ATP-binding cassette domain-containing protein [Reinekea blandensis]EAR07870.1 ABC transporter, duplicated ATPase domains [Reinekea sp. MED297] [Reinekea blandensis MED297]
MSLISLFDVSYQAGTKALFSQLSVSIEPGDRIGLVGHNGSGKSTLLALMAGDIAPDDGRVQRQRGLVIGRVEQFLPDALLEFRLLDAVTEVLPPSRRLSEQFRVESLLSELGFTEAQWCLPMQSLSGGQKNLALFARAVLLEPELLLLDEPGNHMDSSAMWALKTYLQKPDVPGFIMISHDRDLLDSVTDRTLWLRDERIYSFNRPYSDAKIRLAEQDEAAARTRKAEEQQIDKLQRSAKRLAHWGKVYDNEDLARKAKTMEKRIDRLEAEKTFVSQGSGLSLTVDAELLKARQMFILENEWVTAPDGSELFRIDELLLKPGDRVALLGVNGAGKSSAIRKLIHAHQTPQDQQTTTRFNPNVRLGYFDQELERFETDQSIQDWVREQTAAGDDDIRQSLIHWGFPYLDHGRSVRVLSGGEKARLLLLTFQLDQPNLLIMDEPTNHIDLQGKEELEADLTQSGLTLLFTSHDRRFIERVATRLWWIHQGQLLEIHDLSRYDDAFAASANASMSQPSTGQPVVNGGEAALSEDHPDRLLERIVELEQLLADDQARKPKFQKPQRQAQWQAEIDQLMRQLDH